MTTQGTALAMDIPATHNRTENGRRDNTTTPRRRYRAGDIFVPFRSRLSTLLFFGSAAGALYFGWTLRDSGHLTAEQGPGYALGIIGGVLMVLLLLYPLRKRARFMHRAGPVKWWFRSHMIFGVAGPVAILYHANFGLGSLNSTVALACMLLVAGSGLVGRYLYARIHNGLYGRKLSLRELREESALVKLLLDPATTGDARLRQRLEKLERLALSRPRGVVEGMARLVQVTLRALAYRLILPFALTRSVALMVAERGWDNAQHKLARRQALKDLRLYLGLMSRIGHFAFFERLFALWHLLHFPLFLMMVVSGIVHVVAVHLY